MHFYICSLEIRKGKIVMKLWVLKDNGLGGKKNFIFQLSSTKKRDHLNMFLEGSKVDGF